MGYRKGTKPKTAGQSPPGAPKLRHAGAAATGRRPRFVDEPEALRKFLQYVELGASQGTAAECVGWSGAVVTEWLTKADADAEGGPYAVLAGQVRAARAKAVMTHLACVSLAAKGGPLYNADGQAVGIQQADWKASRFMLSVLEPQQYAARRLLEVSGPNGSPVGLQLYVPELDRPEADAGGDEPDEGEDDDDAP